MNRSPRLRKILAMLPGGRARDPRGSALARWLVYVLVAAYFVVALAYLGLRHYAWPRLDDWRPQLTEQLGALAGRPVVIGRIVTGFEGLLPRLSIDELRIDDDDGSVALSVPRATAVLSLASIVTGEMRLSVLQLDSPTIRVERMSGQRLRVAGIDVPLDGPDDASGLQRLFGQRRILLRGATVDWVDHERDRRDRIEAIDLSFGSVGRRHRGALTIGSAGPGWQRAHLAFEIFREAGAAPADWRRWSGEAFVGIDGFDAATVRAAAPLDMPLAAARGNLKAWMAFERGRARDTRVKLAAEGIEWQAENGALRLTRLETDLTTRAEPTGYAMRVFGFRASGGRGFELAAAGEQSITLDRDGQPTAARLSTGTFDAGAALAFARELPLAAPWRANLAPLRLSGRITSLDARWSGASAPDLQADVDFERLSMRYESGPAADTADEATQRPRIPWFENLSGEARVTRDGGTLRVRGGPSTLAFPGIFAEAAIPFDSLKAEANWKLERSGDSSTVEVDLRQLQFANPDAAGVVSGHYRSGGKGPGVVDLQGRLERAEIARVARYLPVQIDRGVRDWVARSIRAGRSDDTRFRVKGDLWDFPFRDAAEGDFSINARVVDGALAYAPDWPAIERFQGALSFERAGMRIQMRSGKVFDVALGSTQATLKDFAEPQLRIEGSGEGPAADMLRFVNESPVATRIDDFTRDTVARGNAKLQLRLDLPLGDLENSRVAGTVQFLGNDLRLDNTIPPFSSVSGALEFTERGLALRAITSTFLGGPLRVDGETPEPGRFVIRGEGAISAQSIRGVVDNSLTRALEGRTAYRANIDVRHRASTVRIESDLEGLSSSLPAPLNKPAAARWPLRVDAVPEPPRDQDNRPRRDTIRVRIGESIRLVVERERDPGSERLLIRRGSLALNTEPVLQDTGLSLVLDTGEVDIDAWLPLLSGGEARDAQQRASSEFAQGFSLLPSYVSVVAARVHVGGRDLHEVVFGASREGATWRANVSAREVNGFFNWRDPGPGQRIGTLTARFQRLEIPRSRAREVETLLDTPPSDLPALDVAAEEFVLFERRLGRLELRATNSSTAVRPGWRLDELRIVNDAAQFGARGSWAQSGPQGRRTTQLLFDLDLIDSARLLALYGMNDVVRGAAGRISGVVHWNGSPLAIDYPSLGGDIDLKIGKGQFLKTDPGIAKLIGVLNLQSLPRRLALDFSDVFAEGFAFDSITGDVAIASGVARTDNLAMRGPNAQVRIGGQANIELETQALSVEVRPELNAGLASLAYGAIVNPVIGLGSFIAQYALRGPIQQIFTYEYDIKGSWTDPQVVEKRRQIESAPAPEATP